MGNADYFLPVIVCYFFLPFVLNCDNKIFSLSHDLEKIPMSAAMAETMIDVINNI